MIDLYTKDLKDFPQAMVPHCSFYNGKGYDHFKSLNRSPKDWKYFTNNLIVINVDRFRFGNYADAFRNFYNDKVNLNGNDPAYLTQDIQNPA